MQIMTVGKGAVADPRDGIRNGILRSAPCGGIADQVRTVFRIQDPVQIAVRRALRVNAKGQNVSTNDGEMSDYIPTDEEIAASVAKLPKID